MARRDLLIEIGTEELPPKSLRKLAESFAEEVRSGLDQHNLAHGDIHRYATPRRLAVTVDRLVSAQKDQNVEKRGPALAAAYDDNNQPTRAAEGFARSCNARMEDLEILETDKGKRLVFRTTETGRETAELLPGIIRTALSRLPIARRMRWGEGEAEFVRPVHWSMVLLGRDIVPCDILETRAGNETLGHRFHHPKPIRITSAATYAKRLREKGFVIADFDARRESINRQVNDKAQELGGRARIDEDLLDEVTALVEWPVVIAGSFDEAFLQLPREVLITTMQSHQKYFPVTDSSGSRLLASFITIANIDSRDPAAIRRGNERVLRPRLIDAQFFWRRDCATPLQDLCPRLQDVVFQKQLGTLHDKTERVGRLAGHIAGELGREPGPVLRAAALAKCDLFTDMVGEFPELQGIMGRYYARENGEPEVVAMALEEQYQPRFAGDAIPASDTGQVLAIADKLDTLCGIFAIGQTPSGDSDPFGLRRAALGCVRILIEGKVELDLVGCLAQATTAIEAATDPVEVGEQVYKFMMERLRQYYRDQGIHGDVFDAVLALYPTQPFDFHQRVYAINDFARQPEAASLAAANKRIRNILRQNRGPVPDTINPALLAEEAEKRLVTALEKVRDTVQPLLAANDYGRVLSELTRMRDSVDRFFDQVMVMDEDPDIRSNRLALLQQLRDLFLAVADISQLQSESWN